MNGVRQLIQDRVATSRPPLPQNIYDSRQRCELEMAKREQEIKQLQGWKTTVQGLIERFEDLTDAASLLQQTPNGANALCDVSPSVFPCLCTQNR